MERKGRSLIMRLILVGVLMVSVGCEVVTPTVTVVPTDTPMVTVVPTDTPWPVTPTVAPTETPTSEPVGECTIVLEPGTVDYDGSGLGPGNVICLRAGDYVATGSTKNDAVVELIHIAGTEAAPIVIRNYGGQVRIDARNQKRGISITQSEHFRIAGGGDAAIEYGIEIFGASRAGMQIHDGTRHYRIYRVHIHDCPGAGAGIRAVNQTWHVPSGWIHYHTHVHHCWIHDVGTEALYIGQGGGATLKGVQVYDNLLERLGYDGIQVRDAVEGVEIHHNIIHTAGQGRGDNVDQAGGGLLVGQDTVGEWYNNVVINARRGIQLLHAGDGVRIYNNIVVDSGQWNKEEGGIRGFGGGKAEIYNNTIVNSYQFGIKTSGGGTIRDNIVAGSGGGTIIESGAELINNLVDSVDEVGFVDAEGGDFHLRSDSLGVDAGSEVGFPIVDFDGVARPQGKAADVGAYER